MASLVDHVFNRLGAVLEWRDEFLVKLYWIIALSASVVVLTVAAVGIVMQALT